MPFPETGCPIIQMTPEERKLFSVTSPENTAANLERFGYGPTKMLVDKLHISPDRKIGVGVLHVTEERCRDHFGLIRGVDLLEAMAQTYLLLHASRNGLVDDSTRPLFAGVNTAEFKHPSTAGAVLNTVAVLDDPARFGGYAWTLRGSTVVAQAEIVGATTSKEGMAAFIKRSGIMQQRSTPLFS